MKKSIVIILLAAPFVVLAGGWPKKKGSGYYKFGYSFINGLNFFDKAGTKQSLQPSLKFSTLSVYGEYGLTDKLTAIAYVPFATTAKLEAANGLSATSITTMGDMDLGFRLGLITDRPNVVSLSYQAGLPTGRTSTDTSGGEGSLQTGDGELNHLLKIETGHSLKNGFYASSFLGVNFRSNGFSEEIRFGGEIGHIYEGLISILKFQSVNSLQNGDNTDAANSNIFNNNMEILSVAPEIALLISDKLGISVNYTIYLSGKKTLANPNTTIGIFVDL